MITFLFAPRQTLIIKSLLIILLLAIPANKAFAEDQKVKVRITGLFSPERELDLRQIMEQWPDIKLTNLDFNYAEAVLTFDSVKLFQKATPDQVLTRLDEKMRSLTQGTFGIKPVSTTPREKLIQVEILVAGLDCKACCLAAYEIVAKIEGVEQATSSFKAGRITALIDPQKTQKPVLEAALKQRGVVLK